MPEPHVVRIADLKVTVERALSLTEDLLGPEVPLNADYYWHMSVTDAFDLGNEPRTFTVGQLSDDLAAAMDDARPRVPQQAWHDLQHLIGLLRALEYAARK